MRGALACAIAIACLMITPTGVAPPPPSASNGLGNACDSANSNKPCEHLGIIPETNVAAGETRVYANDEYQATGTIHVNGTVVVLNATIAFGDESDGFVVYDGGALSITNGTLEESLEGSAFGIDARAGSAFTLVGSRIWGGDGIKLATNTAEIHHDQIGFIPVALRNFNVSVNVHDVHFLNNDVAVNNTGGFPVLHNNSFEGGQTCVRDWYSDPTIVYNTFRGCHTGIYHHRSESVISFNDMDDDASPPGGGIVVEDTMSPTIEGNIIGEYGTGILIRNARAYIRDNILHNNVYDGIRVENNSAPMDITDNSVYGNGRHGIFLTGASDIDVSGNTVYNNSASGIVVHANTGPVQVDNNAIWESGDDGIHLAAASSVPVFSNAIDLSGGDGIEVVGGSGHLLDWNLISDSGFRGISVTSATSMTLQRNWVNDTWAQGIKTVNAPGIDLSRNHVLRANYGIWVENSDGAYLYYNEVTDANDAGAMIASDYVTLFGDEVISSGRGFWLYNAYGVEAENVYATGNLNSGFHVDGGGFHDLINANMSGNTGHGFVFSGATTNATDLLHPRAIGNGGDGLRADEGTDAFVVRGWYEGNGGAGVRNLGTSTLMTENAWWGSASGPTHPDNPGGTGDEAVGNIDYSPYAETPPGPWSPPTFLA